MKRCFYRTVICQTRKTILDLIVYDPTIGEACLKFGHIYRQPRGMYLSITRRGKVKEILQNWPEKDAPALFCVTDGGSDLRTGSI